MTPKDAIDILSNATGQIPASRKDHEIFIKAINVLGQLVNAQAKPEDDGKTPPNDKN